MQIQIDIQGMFQQSLEQALAPETLKPILDKALDETLQKAISSAFGYGSDFRKLMESSVAEAMPTKVDGLVIMGDLITDRIKQIVGAQQDAALSQIIDAQLAGLMTPAPAHMKLSDLCREMTQRWGSREFDRPEGSRPTFIKKTSSYGSVSFYLDKEESKGEMECDFELHISAGGGQILSLRVRGEDRQAPRKHISRRWNDELYLTQLFAAATQIEIDMHDGEDYEHYYRED